MSNIIDNNSVPEGVREYLRARGVPWTFFKQPRFELKEHVQKFQHETNGKVSIIDPAVQLKAYERTLKNPLERPYLYVIATSHNEIRAGAVALSIFERLSRKLLLDSSKQASGTPYWHQVYGGWRDKLRDDREKTIGEINFLAISNIAVNSTNEKIEKVRDLNYKYIDVPRIMVVAGTNPLKFAYEQLHLRPDRMLFITERKSVDV